MGASKEIKEKAAIILAEIKKAKSILLHCHPSPDPDSVGSALAMKFALEQFGKEATVIKGDSDFPDEFRHFPGANGIVEKNFLEIDQSQFDLFIILDSARIEMVSRRGEVRFSPSLKTIAIDHHQSNSGFAGINLVAPSYPANCQLLYDIFKEWGIKMTPEIAADLFIGMYTDTGAFKYGGVDHRTYEAVSELSKHIADIPSLILKMENSNKPEFIAFEGKALSSIETFLGGVMAISFVPLAFLKESGIEPAQVRTSEVSSFMLTVKDWKIAVSAVEIEPDIIKFSFRSKDADRFDVSKLTGQLGGGGHKAAAGLILKKPWPEARDLVVSTAKSLYNL
ncbi:MAG: DHH family phosphoesterase [Patescibacteria group bacterium]|nr:DHH family phosphoesterase [Patescibacteria group bacterium]